MKFLFIILIVSFVIWLLNRDFFKLSSLEISGLETVSQGEVREVLNEYLDGKILGLIPRDNVLLISRRALRKKISEAFPNLADINVRISKASSLIITVSEREAYALWCRGSYVPVNFDEECFFVDKDGYMYKRAPYFSNGIFLKVYQDGDFPERGEFVLGETGFRNLFSLLHFIEKEYDAGIDHVSLNVQGDVFVFLNSLKGVVFHEDSYPYIVYHGGGNYTLIERNLGIVMGHELFLRNFKRRPQAFEFIDLRIETQVRYKFTPIQD